MTTTIYWAGTDESFEQVLKAEAKVEAALQAKDGMSAGWLEEQLAKLPPIWRHEGSTAVINVHGPVVDGDAGYMRLFGVLGYDNLAQAAIEAAMHPDTKTMLYNFETPGGAVSGLMDMGDILAKLSELKPSAVHTTDLMASAGYWLASYIKNAAITVGPTAVVGSIGVLRVHREASQMWEKMGVKTTVLRSGKYKAEDNSLEPLTEGAKERAEAQLADVHAMFRKQVGIGRPNLTAEDLAEVTEGQTFLGKRAVAAGLADKVGNFDLALKLLDKKKPHGENSRKSTKGTAMKTILTPEQIAQIQAGASLEDLGLVTTASEGGAAPAAPAAPAPAAPAVAAAAPAPAAPAPANADVVALLQSQLTTAQASLVTTTAKLVNLEASTQSMKETHDGLLAIARKEIGRMSVALGGNAAAAESLDAAAAIAEHAKVTENFMTKFPTGRQSLPVGDEKPGVSQVPVGFAHAVKNAPSANR